MSERTRSTAGTRNPSLGFVGIHAGRDPKRPVSQNETLAALFEAGGYEVFRTSAIRRPSLRTAHQIASILAWRQRVDVVIIAVFSGRSFWIADFGSVLARLSRRRVVMFLHGGNLGNFGAAHRRRVERVLMRADRILAPSDFLADAFRAWGLDVRVVRNVLDLDRYDFRTRLSARPRLLWMRTFHEHYDPLMAVQVLADLVPAHPELRMTMAGADQGMLAATKAEADRLGVADRIEFPGYISPEVKRRAFADHDLFLNTNIVDNTPVSVLEAAASGLVPVATKVGGIPALLTDGINSRLVPMGDHTAMAGAVHDLLSTPAEVAALSAGARAMAEGSGWPSVHASWVHELALLVPEADPD